MATGWSTGAANNALDEVAADYTWIQLHTGDPGATGTANVASNSTRQQVTWGSASNGAMTSTNDLEWTSVPASENYTHFTAWSAATEGDFGFSGTITANAVTAGDDFTIPAGALNVSLTLAS
jgi:hypothetical protein